MGGTTPMLMPVLAALAGMVAAAAIAVLLVHRRLIAPVHNAEQVLGRRGSGRLPARAASAIEALLARPINKDPRLQQIHAVTGLPTREPLISRMLADRGGSLALITSKDYDRLCAFDPPMADRLLMGIVDRLAAMLPPARLLAQIDRSHLAIWFGPDVERAAAEAEIAALVYALGDRWTDGTREILPEILVRTSVLDIDTVAPHLLISQTLSAFSVPLVGDDRAGIADLDLGNRARERFLVEQDLRQAVARDEFTMEFQPLIDAARGRVCGAEALLRWHHPHRGSIPPGRFIPIMETAGLSQEIGMWALNHAAREARGWRSAGLADLRVAVNFSGCQLEVEDLPLLVERTLSRHGLSGDALEVELTESIALADGDRAARLCQALRARGAEVAIDDFGTGYSSFSALRALPFDKIKIDRAFVADVDQRRDSQAICVSIIALGRGLGIKVLAEGIETAAEYAWLRANGCEYFQGFYFARPLDRNDFIDFVNDTTALARLLSPATIPISHERLRA